MDDTRPKYSYPVLVGDNLEYALFSRHDKCPTARFVGGTSEYLCECAEPDKCPGIRAVLDDLREAGFQIVAPRRVKQETKPDYKVIVHGYLEGEFNDLHKAIDETVRLAFIDGREVTVESDELVIYVSERDHSAWGEDDVTDE